MKALASVTVLVAGMACGEGNGPEGQGFIEVRTVTVGEEPDADGYSISVDGAARATVPATGQTTVPNLPAGDHEVRLTGVADHCVVAGDNPRILDVAAGETTTTGFAVTCGSAVGSVRVQVATTGESIDEDGYLVALPSGESQPVPANGEVLLTGLPPVETQIRLEGLSSNCQLTSPSPAVVTIPAGGEAQAQFTVRCLGAGSLDLVFSGIPYAEDGATEADLFRVSANGGPLRKLTDTPEVEEGSPAWSLDGTRIVFNAYPSAGITMVMDADGTNPVQLGTHLIGPSWSPDGTKLAGSDGLNIFTMDADGSNLAQLTFHMTMPTVTGSFGNPSWSPDGTRIVYSGRLGLNTVACRIVATDGTGDAKVKEGCAAPAWSPDGTRIAYTKATLAGGRIRIMSPDGTDIADLSELAGIPDPEIPEVYDVVPAWSPDGSQIAFVSNRETPDEPVALHRVFVVNADGTGLRRVTPNFQLGSLGRPTWGPSAP